MTDFHEPWDELTPNVRDESRALKSLKEEIEAVDWYTQRAAVSQNEELRAVLIHNRDEEIEHACMTLEWLRRNMPGWEEQLRTYLFTDVPIPEAEERATNMDDGGMSDSVQRWDTAKQAGGEANGRGLGIGTLKGQ